MVCVAFVDEHNSGAALRPLRLGDDPEELERAQPDRVLEDRESAWGGADGSRTALDGGLGEHDLFAVQFGREPVDHAVDGREGRLLALGVEEGLLTGGFLPIHVEAV